MLLTLRLANSFLSPIEIGKISLLTTTSLFICFILITPVGMYVNRHFHEWLKTPATEAHINSYWLYMILVSSISSALIGLLNYFDLFAGYIPSLTITLILFSMVFFSMFNQTIIYLLNMLGKKIHFVCFSVLTALCSLILALYFTVEIKDNAIIWLSGIALGQLFIAIIALNYVYKFIKLREANITKLDTNNYNCNLSLTGENINNLITFSLPIAIASGLSWFQLHGYRFIIYNNFGLADLGLFFAGYSISFSIITGFESIFATYLQPEFYNTLASSNDKNIKATAWNTYARNIIPALTLVVLTIPILIPKLKIFALSELYQSAAIYMVWGILVEGFRGLSNVYLMAFYAEKNTKALITPNIIAVLLSMTLIYLLIPQYGISGIGPALLISGITYNIFLHKKISQDINIKLPWDKISQAALFSLILYIISKVSDYIINDFHYLNNLGVFIVNFLQLFIIGLTFLPLLYLLSKNTPNNQHNKTYHE